MPNPNSSNATPAPDLAALEASLQAEADARQLSLPFDEADDPPADDPPPAEEIPQSQLDAEATARRKGWKPKAEFDGDPKTWVDAKTFIERGERFASTLQREVEALKTKLAGQSDGFKKLAKFYQESLDAKDTQLKSAIAQLRVQRSQAQADGDHEIAVQLEDRIDLLKEEQGKLAKDRIEAAADVQDLKDNPEAVAPAPAADPMQNPVLQEWIEDGNAWFRDNERLRTYSITLGEQLIAAGETARGRKFLDKVAAKMREEFPRTFRTANPSQPNAGAVEGAGSNASRGAASSAAKGERDLPAEDRRLMQQYVREGWMTKEAFLKSYWERNA